MSTVICLGSVLIWAVFQPKYIYFMLIVCVVFFKDVCRLAMIPRGYPEDGVSHR